MTGRRLQHDPDTFGSRLAEARKSAGMNQTQLAERVGISQSCLSRYEAGTLNPTAGMLFDMAEVLDVDPTWLWNGGA